MSLKIKETVLDSKRVTDLFAKYDNNLKCYLERDEFLKAVLDMLKKYEDDIPEEKLNEIAEEAFNKFDLNHNGTIEYNEFLHFIYYMVDEKGYDY